MKHERKVQKLIDLASKKYSEKKVRDYVKDLEAKSPSVMDTVGAADLWLFMQREFDMTRKPA